MVLCIQKLQASQNTTATVVKGGAPFFEVYGPKHHEEKVRRNQGRQILQMETIRYRVHPQGKHGTQQEEVSLAHQIFGPGQKFRIGRDGATY
jgi:hypothetical protein